MKSISTSRLSKARHAYGASNHIFACHIHLPRSLSLSSIASSSRYQDHLHAVHPHDQPPGKQISPSQPRQQKRQSAPSKHAEEKEDSSNGIIAFLCLSLMLLSIPWFTSQPEALLIFPILLVLPVTGSALRPALKQGLSMLAGALHWAARGSGPHQGQANERRESKMTPPMNADIAEQPWTSELDGYRVRLQPVEVQELAMPGDTASPQRRARRPREATVHYAPPQYPSLSPRQEGVSWKNELVALLPFMKDWGGWQQ